MAFKLTMNRQNLHSTKIPAKQSKPDFSILLYIYYCHIVHICTCTANEAKYLVTIVISRRLKIFIGEEASEVYSPTKFFPFNQCNNYFFCCLKYTSTFYYLSSEMLKIAD